LDSDCWNFPTDQSWNLNWLGQVHRGTPWQTIYLKSANILTEVRTIGTTAQYVGTNTWAVWTGDFQQNNSGQLTDAAKSAPVTDWQLVSLLAALLNTNDLRGQFSVNSTDAGAWAAELDGLIVLTNVSMFPTQPPQFETLTISSNSDQASFVAQALESTRFSLPDRLFHGIGDILGAPALTIQSPFLNLSSSIQQNNGVSDEAYEAIPSQLLPLLREDSIGQLFFDQWRAVDTVQRLRQSCLCS
jgi:hypothetical protein